MHAPQTARATTGGVMACHIPFAFTARDGELVRTVYPDSEIVRISLETSAKVVSTLPHGVGVWVDGGVEGFERWPDVSDNWKEHIKKFAGWQSVGEKDFQQNPNAQTVGKFVSEVLSACLQAAPKVSWVSVPQLPAVSDGSRNKINKALAEAAAAWRNEKKYRGKLILPVILTHQEQANLKTDRNRRIQLAAQCFQRASADGYWVVEITLSDQSGQGPFAGRRFPGLIRLHEEIAEELNTSGPCIAGPYWGLNLVLWARGLITHPAIGLGIGYQYHVPAGKRRPKPAKRRIALPPLRRWATVSRELEAWLAGLPKNDPAYKELRDLAPRFSKYTLEDEARRQVARFYKAWFDKIADTPASGRALALYQDFSTAYVLGKPLPDLPEDEKTARRPERIAEQFMLQCL
ncbi:MAG TPA: hypothetical protein VF311_01920 [Terriglobales bacterium]